MAKWHGSRRVFLKSLGLGAAAVLTSCNIPSKISKGENRPNVVPIMTDDQGYGDLGVTGNPFFIDNC